VREILRNVRKAMSHDGRVIVVEMLIVDDGPHLSRHCSILTCS